MNNVASILKGAMESLYKGNNAMLLNDAVIHHTRRNRYINSIHNKTYKKYHANIKRKALGRWCN